MSAVLSAEMFVCEVAAYLHLFEHFGYKFTVEFLTGLLVGRDDLLHCHILGCKTHQKRFTRSGLLSPCTSVSLKEVNTQTQKNRTKRTNNGPRKWTSMAWCFFTIWSNYVTFFISRHHNSTVHTHTHQLAIQMNCVTAEAHDCFLMIIWHFFILTVVINTS